MSVSAHPQPKNTIDARLERLQQAAKNTGRSRRGKLKKRSVPVPVPVRPVVEPGSIQMDDAGQGAIRSSQGKFQSPTLGVRGRLRLVTRAALDNRTTAARLFDSIVTEMTADMGGTESLSQIERSLIEAYAGASLMVNHLTAKMIEGEQISLQRYSTACGALVRIATRLGVKKKTPHAEAQSLGSYLSNKIEPEDTP